MNVALACLAPPSLVCEVSPHPHLFTLNSWQSRCMLGHSEEYSSSSEETSKLAHIMKSLWYFNHKGAGDPQIMSSAKHSTVTDVLFLGGTLMPLMFLWYSEKERWTLKKPLLLPRHSLELGLICTAVLNSLANVLLIKSTKSSVVYLSAKIRVSGLRENKLVKCEN